MRSASTVVRLAVVAGLTIGSLAACSSSSGSAGSEGFVGQVTTEPPLEGATVQLLDGTGRSVGTPARTSASGHFVVTVRKLPETFTVQVRGGTLGGSVFAGSLAAATTRAEAVNAVLDVNVPTTLLAQWRKDNPGAPAADGERVVRTALGLPASWDLSSAWVDPATYSDTAFFDAARTAPSFDAFVQSTLRAPSTMSFAGAPTNEVAAGGAAGSLAGTIAGKLADKALSAVFGAAASRLTNQLFGTADDAKLDQILAALGALSAQLDAVEQQLTRLQVTVAAGTFTDIVGRLKERVQNVELASKLLANMTNAKATLDQATGADVRTAAGSLRSQRNALIQFVENSGLIGAEGKIGAELISQVGELSLPQAFFNLQTAGRSFYLPGQSADLQTLYSTYETYQAVAAAVEMAYWAAKTDATSTPDSPADFAVNIQQVQDSLKANIDAQRAQLVTPLPNGIAAALPSAGVGNLIVANPVAGSVPYDQVLPTLAAFKASTANQDWRVTSLDQLTGLVGALKNGTAQEKAMAQNDAWFWSSDPCHTAMGQGPFDPFTFEWSSGPSGFGNCKLVSAEASVSTDWHPWRNGQKSYANPWFVRPTADGERYLY